MDDITEVDHYAALDLPSGEQGAKLSQKEISKAYRKKALELHPDKRPDDPNAHANFQKLKTSYDILRDEQKRKLFDNIRNNIRKMMSDHDARERAAAAAARAAQRDEEELRMSFRKFKDEVNHTQYSNKVSRRFAGRKIKEGTAQIRAMHYVKKVSRSISKGKTKKEAARILAMYSKKKL